MKPLRWKRIELTKRSGIHPISTADACIVVPSFVTVANIQGLEIGGLLRLVFLPLVCAKRFVVMR